MARESKASLHRYERSALDDGAPRLCPDLRRAAGGGGRAFRSRPSIALVAAGAAIAHRTPCRARASWLAAMVALMIGDICAVLAGTLHRLGLAGIPLPAFDESGDLHAAFGGIVLQARQDHAGDCQVYSRHQYHGSAAGRQHEDALLAVSAAGFRGSPALLRRPICWSDTSRAIFWRQR